MPLTTETTADYQGIVHIGTGIITGSDFLEACRAALQLVQNTQNFDYEFIDLSAATGLKITAEQLDQITAQDRLAAIYRPNAIIIFVAPRDDLFELGQRWEARVQDLGWSTHIARDRSAAWAWLAENRSSILRAEADPSSASEMSSPTL